MAARITPRLIELTYEAALKSFWRKNALKKFLLSSHVSEKFISGWGEESKREVLDDLFTKLQTSDRGKAVIYEMAKFLSEQTSFPDLRNWEDSDIKIQAASKAVSELKQYLKKQNEDIKTEREKQQAIDRALEEKIKIKRASTDLSKLQERLEALQGGIGTQHAGYDFESWFFDLLDFSEIVNKRPYKTDGRQIDGSLTNEGTTYLVELKFTKNQSGAPDIDTFKAKVDKMADNTMGIMVSMSGYSSTAISEASSRKSTIILLDYSHLYLFFSGVIRFDEILSRVRRHASQTGEAFLPTSKFHS